MSRLLLVDGHSILSRAFFGIPQLTSPDGFPTNAIYGFMNILLKAIEDEEASHIVVAFDLDRKKLKRTSIYPAYKGTRKPMPEELHMQVEKTKELLNAMQVPVVTMEGYEADDILGTLAKSAQEEGTDVTILSGDRDLLQLSDRNIKISIPKTAKGHTEVFHYYPEDVLRDYHVTPEQFIDLKALQGDTSDNIPGLPGVGEKTAADIISKYGTIENAREHAEDVKPPRASKALMESFELAQLSKELATIDIHVPLGNTVSDFKKCCTDSIFTKEALEILRSLNLKTLAARFSEKISGKGMTAEASGEPEFLTLSENRKEADRFFDQMIRSDSTVGLSVFVSYVPAEEKQLSLFEPEEGSGPAAVFAALSDGEDTAAIVSGECFKPEELLEKIRNFVKGFQGTLSVFDLKKALKEIPELENVHTFDPAVAAYLLNPLRDSYAYEAVAAEHLGTSLRSSRELRPKGTLCTTEEIVYSAFTASRSYMPLREKLKSEGMLSLYDDIEHPLIFSLNEMENRGVRTDRNALTSYASYLKEKTGSLESRIYEEAGEIFNVNSPVQLGTILFEKLGIKGSKKTKTGYSTAADVLEKLAPEYEIVRNVLEYRTYTKLCSTYAEGLKGYISRDERIHGTFNQTVTATGRISSTDPNLQNIPVRTEAGRKIREVFIPEPGYIFMDADYSQVELRILASLSGDEKLIAAYRESVDIHTLTASEVFGVSPENVTPEMRRNAKAVNFGIVYGISAFGLGEDLSISRKEALDYIEKYFATYPGVKKYLDDTVKSAKEKGYAVTLFGRKRPVPELKSPNFMERQFGERVAMNSPVQGTAADIMKIAMNRVRKDLENMKSGIVLQIHDELLVEVWPDEEEEVRRILKRDMEGAAELAVKLKTDIKTGGNWNECH